MFIIFYGNCQAKGLARIFKFRKFGHEVKIIDCVSCDWEESKMKRFISRADIIIMSFIKPGYRGKHYLSSDYIVKHCPKKTKILILPCIYYSLYFIDAFHFKTDNAECKQIRNHHRFIVESYLKGESPSECIEKYLENSELYTIDQLKEIQINGLKELEKREKMVLDLKRYKPINLISIKDFIEKNHDSIDLFYTFHHPRPPLMRHIIKQIANILNINIKNVSMKTNPYEKYEHLYICKTVQKILNFDITEHNTDVLKKYNNSLLHMVSEFYNLYNKPENQHFLEYYKKNNMNGFYIL